MDTITYKIDTGTDIGNTTLQNQLKDYAKTLNWIERIEDPENPGEFIDNPVTYIQAIFGDDPMKRFWDWRSVQAVAEARATADVEALNDVDAQRSSTVLSIITE